jgi:hypothetical protein
MKKSAIFVFALMLLFTAFAVAFVSPVKAAYKVIYIRSDGSIDPATAAIRRDGGTYYFTDNVDGSIVVDEDNLVIDGAGYVLQGPYNGTRTDSLVVGQGPDQELSSVPWTIGIDLANRDRCNLTVKNLNIKNFSIGIYVWTSNNTITGNAVCDNIVGILLSGDSNTITENYIANNEEGIFFGVNTPGNEPLNIVLTDNSFVDNDVQFSGCFCKEYNTEEAVHTWDDGERGNYWSNYNGTDANGDSIGDTSYVIDYLNQDRYPLMNSAVTPPAVNPKFPSALVVAAVVSIAVVGAGLLVYFRKHNH